MYLFLYIVPFLTPTSKFENDVVFGQSQDVYVAIYMYSFSRPRLGSYQLEEDFYYVQLRMYKYV